MVAFVRHVFFGHRSSKDTRILRLNFHSRRPRIFYTYTCIFLFWSQKHCTNDHCLWLWIVIVQHPPEICSIVTSQHFSKIIIIHHNSLSLHIIPYIYIYIYICIYIYTHRNIYIYTHIYIYAYIYMYIYTYIHACMHACIHACMHAYIHTLTYICIYIAIAIATFPCPSASWIS